MKKALCFLFLLLTCSSAETILTYREKTGEETMRSTVTLTQSDTKTKTIYSDPEQILSSVSSSIGNTVSLEIISTQKMDTISVKRNGNRLSIFHEGNIVAHEIDNAPWYGDLSNLRFFIQNRKERVKDFWIVSANFSEIDDMGKGIKPIKMRIKKKGYEHMSVAGNQIKAQKCIITLADWRSIFWKAEYWFDSDGFQVKSVQKRGGPFTPKTVVTLTGKEL